MQSQERQVTRITKKNQSGQTLVEFILLLSVITIISFGFMSTVNRIIGDRWRSIAQIILEDDTQTLELQ